MKLPLPTVAQLVTVMKSVARAAVAGALIGASSYATGHQAESPILMGVILVALRDLDHAAKARGAA